MRTVLIGKSRRVTLEELQSVAFHDGQLEMHSSAVPEAEAETDTETDANNDATASAADELAAAISNLSISDSSSLLSAGETLASLTLLALTISQDRILPSKAASALNFQASESIVQLVNAIKSSASASSSTLTLPSTPAEFLSTLVDILSSSSSSSCSSTHLNDNSTPILKCLTRIIPLASISLATIQSNTLSKTSIIDAIAATSAERTCTDSITAYSDIKYDANRPHRGMTSSASVLRAVTQGSKFATANSAFLGNIDIDIDTTSKSQMTQAIQDVPAYHGPASEAIMTAKKVMELECNIFESIPKGAKALVELDTTVLEMTAKTVYNAVQVLLDGCNARMGVTGTGTSASSSSSSSTDLTALAMELSQTVQNLYAALTQEVTSNTKFIEEQMVIAKEAALKKAQEKAKRAAALTAAAAATADGKKDEFEGMSEKQKEKILKKRAEKEAKAAKKKAAKLKAQGGGAGGASDVVSIFGTGTMAVISILNSTNDDTDGMSMFTPAKVDKLEIIIAGLLSGGVQRKPKIAKGTRDYLPEQMMIRDQAFQIIRRVFKSHGAVEIDTPVFELKDTLTGKYGEDSKLIYDLADQGGELLALRYDLTVPFARFLALNSVGNIKRFHIGKVYRRDQPALSKGRYREFYQCDFDIAGTYGRMVPDSECLCVASEILSSLDIGDFAIKLNHRRLLDAILDICGVPADKFRTICSAVDKLDKEPWSEVKREMVEDKGLKAEVADKIGEFVVRKGAPWEMYNALMDSKAFGTHAGALEAMEDLRILFEYLGAMDKLKYFSFDLSLARGLDYYTGVIYEAVCMNGNTQVGSIGGGGRYDNLVSMFQEAGKITPCVGVSVGIERVFTLMEQRLREQQGGSIKQPNVKILVAQAGENMMLERMKVTKLLWDANISAEFNQQENPKLTYEIKDALERNIPFMVIVGEEEAKENKCKVKDLKNKTEDTVSQDQLASTLRKMGVIPVGCEFAAEMLATDLS